MPERRIVPEIGAQPPRTAWPDEVDTKCLPRLCNPGAVAQPLEGSRLVRLDNRRALIAVSPAMREVRRQIEQVADIDAAVLLMGESGTGKEVIARMIHKLSERGARIFVKANCAMRPQELLEAELFGPETPAADGRAPRAGKFDIAGKGSILLDEIGELPQALQTKLLQVLEEGEFPQASNSASVQSSARVIAASTHDLRPAVESGAFRADLYYRLNVFAIHVPPLRERGEDLPYLLNHLMTSWAADYGRPRLPITRRILEACASHPWPGNVRELENFVKRYLVLGDQDLALEELKAHSPAKVSRKKKPVASADEEISESGCNLKSIVRDLKQDAERAAIVQALEQTGGNRQDAANLLHISLRGLHYKLRAYGIDASSSRARSYAGQRESAKLRPIDTAGRNLHTFPAAGGGKVISMDRAAWPPVR